MSDPKVVEGVFAIYKPPSITSAQVVRDLQQAFNPSQLFAPWIAAERAARERENLHQKKRRRDKRVQVKIGHGGTLDPLATGVLIIGVGKGTKQLQSFLDGTKDYETTVLFGAATDTYDMIGKVLGKAPYTHISQETVEKALAAFRGKIMQRPPIYSALKMQGKPLYEYAREGKELPKEIVERPMDVKSLEILEWLPSGTHTYRWPSEEADVEEKEVAEKVLHINPSEAEPVPGPSQQHGETKRKRVADGEGEEVDSDTIPSLKRQELDSQEPKALTDPEPDRTGHGQEEGQDQEAIIEGAGARSIPDEAMSTSTGVLSGMKALDGEGGPPAVRLRMTVTSGFYVRSLCHDLGKALGSLGIMAALIRTRQGTFEVGRNVLEYDDLKKGEDVWAPKVKSMLEEWNDRKQDVDLRNPS